MNPKWKILLSAVILAVGVGFLFLGGQVDKRVLWQSLSQFGPTCIALVNALSLIQLVCMTLRLHALLPRDSNIGLKQTLYAFGYGQFLNTFVPARAGELVKLTLLKSDSRASTPAILGALVSEKVVDVIALVILVLASGVLTLPKVSEYIKIPEFSWKVSLTVAIAFSVIGVATQVHPKLRQWRNQLFDGLKGLGSPRQVSLGLLVSFFAWSAEAGALMAQGHFQGIHFSYPMAVFALFALNVAIAVPISIANIGTFEASIVFALQALGVSFDQALAIATFHHFMQLAGIAQLALLTWFFCRRKS